MLRRVTLLDVFAWLLAHLQLVLVMAAPDDGPGWLDYMPAATALAAVVGVFIASRALIASRTSARAAVAALDAGGAPLVVLESISPGQGHFCYLDVRNIGRGPALDVQAFAATYLEQGIMALHTSFLGGRHLLPIAEGDAAKIRTMAVNGAEFQTPTAIELLLIYRDVSGVERYSYARPGLGPNAFPTITGKELDDAAAEFRAKCERKAVEAAGR